MAKKQYGHDFDRTGKVRVVETTLPRRLQGYDEYSTGTIREGLLARLLTRRR